MKCKICNFYNNQINYVLRDSEVFVCKQCGFHYSNYLDQEIGEIDSLPDFGEIIVPDDLKHYLRHQLQNNLRKFSNQVEISMKYIGSKPAKALDIGSGGGLFLSLLKAKGLDCYGIELDLKRLKFSMDEYKLDKVFPFPVQSDFWIENHKSSFDLITLWDVIEHVNSPVEVIKFSSLLLKQNGVLLIDTPCRDTFYYKFGEFTYRISKGKTPTLLNIMYSNHPFGHKQILSKKDIECILRISGFKIKFMRVFHELSFPVDYYLMKILRNRLVVNILNPIVGFLIKILPIKNKMIVVGSKE